MTNHPQFTESHDSAARSVGYEGAREIRREPSDCRHEPDYPLHKTVIFSLRDPYTVAHFKSRRCKTEEPHAIKNCGEFDRVSDMARKPTT